MYSGSIHFPEFGFISLSPPSGFIEILSMGNYSPKKNKNDCYNDKYLVQGAYHCVINNETAHLLHINNGKLST